MKQCYDKLLQLQSKRKRNEKNIQFHCLKDKNYTEKLQMRRGKTMSYFWIHSTKIPDLLFVFTLMAHEKDSSVRAREKEREIDRS